MTGPGGPSQPPTELPEWRLSEQENQRRFEDRIVPGLLAGRPARESPLAIVLLAQPGAGKTRSGDNLAALLGGEDHVIRLDSDRFKPYHPVYERLLRADDRRLTPATRLDAIRWNQKAQAYARSARADVILDNTANRLDLLVGTLDPFRQAGYRIAAFAMAVPEAASRQGIVQRYVAQREASGGGRLTPPDRAASSYRGVTSAAAMIEDQRLADVTAVFRRGLGEATYYNKLRPDGAWKHPSQFATALEHERARPLAPAEASAFLEGQTQLRAALRGELGERFAAELAVIDELAAPLLAPNPRVEPGPGLAATGRGADYLLERTRAAPPPQHALDLDSGPDPC